MEKVRKLLVTAEKQREKRLADMKETAKKMFNTDGSIYDVRLLECGLSNLETQDKKDVVPPGPVLSFTLTVFDRMMNLAGRLLLYIFSRCNKHEEKAIKVE